VTGYTNEDAVGVVETDIKLGLPATKLAEVTVSVTPALLTMVYPATMAFELTSAGKNTPPVSELVPNAFRA
jgi:hypothetical protein